MAAYVEIDLDRPRKLSYRFVDIHDLCHRLGNITFAQAISRFRDVDPQVIVLCLEVGLRHEDSRVSYEKAKVWADIFVEKTGSIEELMVKIDQALAAVLGPKGITKKD